MKGRFVQFSAGFNLGDAISNEMLSFKNKFSSLGYKAEIYSENLGTYTRFYAKKYTEYTFRKNDIIIYHHSIHSKIFNFIKDFPCKKVLIYHNVTPHHFFLSYDLKLSHFLKKGREELKDMKSYFSYSFADSEYNLTELKELGFKNTHLLPILYEFEKFDSVQNRTIKSNEIKKILFVGRIAPNKKQEDLIRIAKILKEFYSIKFRIDLVGYCSKELESYKKELEALIKIFQLEEVVYFSDFITDKKLIQYYSEADIFLCLSEHEGFCVPLIEAMYFDVPVIAYSAGAVADTLNGAGILFLKKDFKLIAEMIYKLITEKDFQEKIIKGQRFRMQEYRENKCIENFNQIILNLL